jgi:hypothetical protein
MAEGDRGAAAGLGAEGAESVARYLLARHSRPAGAGGSSRLIGCKIDRLGSERDYFHAAQAGQQVTRCRRAGLQGIGRHSATGVMKEVWTAGDFGGMRLRPLSFTPLDINLIYSAWRRAARPKKAKMNKFADARPMSPPRSTGKLVPSIPAGEVPVCSQYLPS